MELANESGRQRQHPRCVARIRGFGKRKLRKNDDINSNKTVNYRVHLKYKSGSRPVSRVLSWTVIPLGRLSPDASSNQPGNGAGRTIAPLFGLAPGGVCPATPVARGAVRSYRTISTLPDPVARPSAVYFLWHFPSARAAQALPGTLPYGARTFLHACAQRLSSRLPPGLYQPQNH